ncbi:DUF3043 domain-containing protein, partial [Burkholderia sp. SIMBA_024]|uniref:DUF3043 domain-containing protein n=1 Tax=Burkholderia sp. SIMBA_024 TaxID=3085768 RepID=UPI003978B05A
MLLPARHCARKGDARKGGARKGRSRKQRRWVRDYVDAGWHPAEFVMAVMVLVILASLIPANLAISFYA